MSTLIKVLVVLDCIVNWLLAGDINETMSSRAYRIRGKGHPYWSWTADAIDWVALHVFGQADHCAKANAEEQAAGGALAWLGLRRAQ